MSRSSFLVSSLTISFRESAVALHLEVCCLRKQQKLPPSRKCCILLVWTSCSLDSGGYGLIWQPPPGRRVKSAVPGTGVGKFLQFICQPRPSLAPCANGDNKPLVGDNFAINVAQYLEKTPYRALSLLKTPI